MTEHTAEMDIAELAATLAEIIRKAQARAYAEGYADAIDDYGTDLPWGGMTPASNTYLDATT